LVKFFHGIAHGGGGDLANIAVLLRIGEHSLCYQQVVIALCLFAL